MKTTDGRRVPTYAIRKWSNGQMIDVCAKAAYYGFQLYIYAIAVCYSPETGACKPLQRFACPCTRAIQLKIIVGSFLFLRNYLTNQSQIS